MEVTVLDEVAEEPYCYLTTTGRRTGRPHEIEIWFATDGRALHLISGGADRSDWVRNLLADPSGRVRVGGREFAVRARVPLEPGPERWSAVERLHAKYGSQVSSSVADWHRDGYLLALDPLRLPR